MAATTSPRFASIDILRGLIMIIMALDHTRDFFHATAMTADPLDPETTTIPLFFTRWITHFCAPTFVLLSGLSAYLSSKNKPSNKASGFLIKRGLWLILVEVTLVTLGLTFNPVFSVIILQVIWAIGCSMIVLGVLMRVSYYAVLAAGLILFFGHNALDYAQTAGNLWTVLFTARGAVVPINSNHLIGVLYAVLPWTGVMLLGYCMGKWYEKDFPARKRKQLLTITGLALIGLFILIRVLKGYGDPNAWQPGVHSLLSFLNTSKYPPSLQYSCMTLGPSILLLAFFENVQSAWSRIVSIYGRVPFFYYILHFYILHTLLVLVFFASGHTAAQIVDTQIPFLFRPRTFGYGLWVVYAIWMSVVAALYFPCRWFNKYKMEHRKWWLHYI